MERLEESNLINQAERTVFKDTRSRVAHVQAYIECRPTDLSSVEDLSWVRKLRSVFENDIRDQEVGSRWLRRNVG